MVGVAAPQGADPTRRAASSMNLPVERGGPGPQPCRASHGAIIRLSIASRRVPHVWEGRVHHGFCTSFLIQILNALQYGLLLFLVASGLTLVFGIMGIINLAHGSFYMIGAYLAFALTSLTGNLMLAIVLGIPLAFGFGALLEWAALRASVQTRPPAAGAADLRPDPDLRGVRSLTVGDDVHGVAIPICSRPRSGSPKISPIRCIGWR